MNCFIPENPTVELLWDFEIRRYRVRTNVHPNLKVKITGVPIPGTVVDTSDFKSLPFEVNPDNA